MDSASPSLSFDHMWAAGTWIAARRRYLTLTQDQLAERVGDALKQQSDGQAIGENCSPRTIRYIEAGRRPSLRIARGLTLALEISLDERGTYINWFCQQPLVASWYPPDPRQKLIANPSGSSHATAPSALLPSYQVGLITYIFCCGARHPENTRPHATTEKEIRKGGEATSTPHQD